MNGLHVNSTVIEGGYQLCEGCGDCLVNRDRALYRETYNGRSYIHNSQKCASLAVGYLTEKEHTDREVFPASSPEIYGEQL